MTEFKYHKSSWTYFIHYDNCFNVKFLSHLLETCTFRNIALVIIKHKDLCKQHIYKKLASAKMVFVCFWIKGCEKIQMDLSKDIVISK